MSDDLKSANPKSHNPCSDPSKEADQELEARAVHGEVDHEVSSSAAEDHPFLVGDLMVGIVQVVLLEVGLAVSNLPGSVHQVLDTLVALIRVVRPSLKYHQVLAVSGSEVLSFPMKAIVVAETQDVHPGNPLHHKCHCCSHRYYFRRNWDSFSVTATQSSAMFACCNE